MKSDSTEIIRIVPSAPTTPLYIVYPHRFYVLFVFAFLAFNQCLIWLTFSPIARNAEIYYNVNEATIDLLLNWGPIIFIPFLPLSYILMNTRHGLRRCIIVLSVTSFIATLIRIIPLIILSPSNPRFRSISVIFLHIGQIVNAACGPMSMTPVSQISCLWFAAHERTRATTVAIFATNLGSTVGFLIGPFIVSSPNDVPYLLYLHLGLAFIACIFVLLYFPPHPPSPASAAAELLMNHSTIEPDQNRWKKFMKDLWQCFTTPSFVLLSMVGGLVSGTFGSWTGVYDNILKPENYTERQAGWFSFGSTMAGIVGGSFLSCVADTRRFQHSLKFLILTSYIGCTLSVLWFELSVHTFFYDRPPLSSNGATIGLSTALAGLFSGAAAPLLYEATAEIMYPLPESLSASILVQWINVTSSILLFIAPNHYKLINLLVLIILLVCILLVSMARFTYKRRDEDERRRLETEQNQFLDNENLNSDGNNIINESQYGTFS